MKRIMPVASAFAVITVVALSGCVGAPPTGDATPSAEEVGQQFQEAVRSLQDYEATERTTFVSVRDDGSRQELYDVTAHLLYEREDRYRYEYTAPEGFAGFVMGANGTVRYHYSPGQSTAWIHPLADKCTDPSPFPVDVEHLFARYEVSNRGTAEVDARETDVLELVPTENASEKIRTVNATVWLDRETSLPVQIREVVRIEGRTFVTTRRYTNVSVDAGLSDEQFTFDPPPGTQIVRQDADAEPRWNHSLNDTNVEGVGAVGPASGRQRRC